MANQRTPVVDAVQEVALEKIILSGTAFQSSILGPESYRITADLAPLFYTNPLVTGEVLPPTTFYCDEGAFNSSPRADLVFQWFYDSVLMIGGNDRHIDLDEDGLIKLTTGNDVFNIYPTFAGTTTSKVTMPAFSLPSTAITVEFLVRTVALATDGMFSYATAGQFNELTIFNGTDLAVIIAGSTENTGIQINAGEWTQIAVTWQSSDGETKVYLNGNIVHTYTTNSGGVIDPSGILILAQEQDSYGGGFDPDQTLDGEMCEVRVWDYVRTGSEISSNRGMALVGNETGLVHYWPLNEGTGSVANDLGPTPVDGVYNDVTWNILNDGPVYIEREVSIIYGGYAEFFCQVTATNTSGTTMAQSNNHHLEVITPSIIYEMDVMAIGGLDDPWRQVVSTAEIYTLAGVEHFMKIDINELDLYVPTGLPNDVKIDLNEINLHVITGVSNDVKIDLVYMNVFAITAVSNVEKIDVQESGAYAMRTFERLGTLALINGDAEAVDMTAWTIDEGDVTMVSSASGNAVNYFRTGDFFKGQDRGIGLDSQMSQVVVIDGGFLTDVDLGRVYAAPAITFYAGDLVDGIRITLEALNAVDAVLNTQVGPLHLYPHTGSKPGWYRIEAAGDPLSLPTLTRKIKVTILFEVSDTTGTANNGYCDNIVIDLLKLD